MMFLLFAAVLVIGLGVSQWASARYQTLMGKGARATSPTAYHGGEIALLFLQAEGVHDVQIVEHDGVVTDYYDPVRRRLFLRSDVAQGTTLAAWAISLHEAAHALQTGTEGLGELKWRQSCIRMCR
jgi:uncharacterized protein